jgi:hypothetical protein
MSISRAMPPQFADPAHAMTPPEHGATGRYGVCQDQAGLRLVSGERLAQAPLLGRDSRRNVFAVGHHSDQQRAAVGEGVGLHRDLVERGAGDGAGLQRPISSFWLRPQALIR